MVITVFRSRLRPESAQEFHELAAKMKQLNVKLGELKEVSELKAKLAKSGLGLATLADLAKEFSHDSTKG